MTDEVWPCGWHLSLSWFWLVWHHGAVHWSMVHGEEVLVLSLQSTSTVLLPISLSALEDPLSLRGLFLYFCTFKLPKVTFHPLHMDKHLAEQQLSEVGKDLCWHTLPKSHIHIHSDELCNLCQDWKEASWYFGLGCSGLPPVVHWLFL